MTDAWLACGRAVLLSGVLLLVGVAAVTWAAPARAVRAPLGAAGALMLCGLALQWVGQLRAFDAFLPDADPIIETLAMIARTGWGRNRLLMTAAGLGALATGLLVRSSRVGDWSARALALVALGLIPRLGHAAAVEDGVMRAYLLAFTHAGAAALWLGLLALLARGWWLDVAPLRAALVPYGRLALAAAPVTLLSGVVTAWPRFGRLGAILETPYGQLLAVKATVAGVVLSLGAVHHRRLVRRGDMPARRTLLLEVLLALVILALTGWLAETAPPTE